MELTYPALDQLLPHRAPMILLDRMLDMGPGHAVGEVAVRPDSPFAEAAGVPALVGIEYLAQTIGALSGWRGMQEGKPVRLGFLLSATRYEATHPYFPNGEKLRVDVRHVWGDGELMQFEGSISGSDGGERATAVLNVFRPEDPGKFLEDNA